MCVDITDDCSSIENYDANLAGEVHKKQNKKDNKNTGKVFRQFMAPSPAK